MRRIAITLSIVAAGLLVAACSENEGSNSITGVSADQTLRVGIVGPVMIRENGTYQWYASLSGASADDVQYTWEIVRTGAPDDVRHQTVSAPIFETFIDLEDWRTFELVLTANAGGLIATDRAVVTLCPFIEEPVDECSVRFVFAEN